jgi:phospholipid/cholesterol/gamma-HCH transport system substrate-binding protein
MVTRSQKIRLGIFITIAMLILLATLGIVTTRKLFEANDTYYIGYKDISVTGLQEGGSVKYQGINVGYVSQISIDPEDIRRVIVEVSLEKDTPIKKDTYAEIAVLGITGLKLIELRGGSNEAESLKPGEFIKPGRSLTEDITGKAEVIAEKAELILNNIAALTTSENREKILSFIETSSLAVADLRDILHNNKTSISKTLANTEQVTSEFGDLVTTTKSAIDEIGVLVQSDSVKHAIANIVEFTDNLKKANLIRLVQELNEALVHTNRVLKEVDIALSKSQSDLIVSVAAMKESAEYLNQFSRMITEDPSLLVRGTRPKNAPDFQLER